MFTFLPGWTPMNGGGNTDNTGLGLPYTYFNNWAYLSEVGVPPANGGPNVTFAILVGEFGNIFNSSLNATDMAFSDQDVRLSPSHRLGQLGTSISCQSSQ